MASETENMSTKTSREDVKIRIKVIDLKPLEGQDRNARSHGQVTESVNKLGNRNVQFLSVSSQSAMCSDSSNVSVIVIDLKANSTLH